MKVDFVVGAVMAWALWATPVWAGTPISLPQIAKQTMAAYFSTHPPQNYTAFAKQFAVPSMFQNPAGVFVTLSRGGKSRACWGSLLPHNDIVKSTVFATLGALTKDYRYTPIRPTEWETLKTQVTVVKSVQAVSSFRQVNPFKDGMLVRAGGKSGVLLPGEARDAYYEMVQCKLKAGIGPHEPFQLYRIIANVYR